jgi:hypothetical protein
MQVANDDDHVERCRRQARVASFEVNRRDLQRQPQTPGFGAQVFESGGVPVDGERLQPALREPDSVSAAAAGDIGRGARTREQMLMIDEPACWFHHEAPIALAIA